MAKFLQDAAMTRKRARSTADDNEEMGLESIVTYQGKDKTSSRLLSARKSKKPTESELSTIIYVGHIPHGFYEKEMRSFFDQFGKVVKLKLFRSTKSKKSKGYAFIQFESHEVAKTVSETMDGYFIHERQLVSNVIPKSKCHEGMFKRPKKTVLVLDPIIDKCTPGDDTDEKSDKSANVAQRKLDVMTKKQKQKQKKLQDLGIDYDILLANSQ